MFDANDPSTLPADQRLRMEQAFSKHIAQFYAMDASEVIRDNVDIPSVFTTSLGKLKRLGALREAVLTLPLIDKELVANVDEYLLALGHAQVLYFAQRKPKDDVPGMYQRLLEIRRTLGSDARALIQRELIPADRAVELKWPISRIKVAFDVLAMSVVFRTHWSSIADRCAVTEAELGEAESLADEFLVALGVREPKPASSDARHVRMAALTLFARAYDELRRGVSFIRWHQGDVDVFLPKLYRKGKRGKKRKSEPTVVEPAVSEGLPIRP